MYLNKKIIHDNNSSYYCWHLWYNRKYTVYIYYISNSDVLELSVARQKVRTMGV